jgi:hypothetical protein
VLGPHNVAEPDALLRFFRMRERRQ